MATNANTEADPVNLSIDPLSTIAYRVRQRTYEGGIPHTSQIRLTDRVQAESVFDGLVRQIERYLADGRDLGGVTVEMHVGDGVWTQDNRGVCTFEETGSGWSLLIQAQLAESELTLLRASSTSCD